MRPLGPQYVQLILQAVDAALQLIERHAAARYVENATSVRNCAG